ncbi:MAG: acyl-CoA thioesterase [Lentisphaerae bacterium]|nr:acyl-CoA thioesterase [Lentisphaerota bacterium]
MYYEMQYRVTYADTDQMGVVYYANYLEYFERARTEMFRSIGLPYSEMEAKGVIMPVSEAHCKYLSSARYDDLLTFRCWISEYSRVRVKIATEVRRDDEVLASGYVVLACVGRDFRVARLPQWMVEFCDKCLLEEEK